MPWPGRKFLLRMAAIAVPAGLAGCTSDLSGHPPPPAHKSIEHPRKVVRVTRPQVVEASLSFPSSLYVERDVRVAARKSGAVEQVLCDRGDIVRSGQPLAILETAAAKADLEVAKQDFLLAETELRRIQPLTEQKIASISDFDRARILRDRAQARVALAETALEQCTVKAPFGGHIVERWAVVGLRVQEDDDTPLFRIVADDPLRARIDVPESTLRTLAKGDRAWVQAMDEATSPMPARVAFVSPSVDAASATRPVIVELSPGKAHFRAGSAVRVRFDSVEGESSPLMKLPREALVRDASPAEGAAEILVVAEGQTATRRVQVVETRGSLVLLRGDLSLSDQVVLGAGPSLVSGEKVEAREEIP